MIAEVALAVQWAAGWLALGGVLRGGLGRRRGNVADVHAIAARVSVIVPARNEAENLPKLLGSIAAQSVRVREVIVVDDDSSDGTADVARDGGARVIRSAALPAGWTGKTWACWQGAQAAAGDLLLFLDADTWFAEPDGLAAVLAAFAGGAMSVAPYHAIHRPYEGLSAFFNLLMVAGTGGFTAWTLGRAPALFGQSLLVEREGYERVGGHEAVRAKVLENFSLARQFEAADVKTSVALGRGALSMRMYPKGLRDLIDGWGKGFAAGAAATPRAVMVLIVLWFGGMITATAMLGRGWLGAAACAAFAVQVFVFLRAIGSFKWYVALLFPAVLGFYLAVFARSVFAGRAIEWKGRAIDAP